MITMIRKLLCRQPRNGEQTQVLVNVTLLDLFNSNSTEEVAERVMDENFGYGTYQDDNGDIVEIRLTPQFRQRLSLVKARMYKVKSKLKGSDEGKSNYFVLLLFLTDLRRHDKDKSTRREDRSKV